MSMTPGERDALMVRYRDGAEAFRAAMADVNDFTAVNAVYAKFMPEPPPARSTIGVAALPKGGLVEIEAIARRATPDAVAGRRS